MAGTARENWHAQGVTSMNYERFGSEIVTQTDLLSAAVADADVTLPVPSCPGWTVNQLVRHLGHGHRWAETIVRTRATEPTSDEALRNLDGYVGEDPATLAAWLAEGAAELAETLLAAGPDATVWTPLPSGERSPAFYARRFTHETLIHRADATLAIGSEFTAGSDVAADAIDEWLELGSLPEMLEFHPHWRELLGPGRTLHLHATDTPPEASAEWVVDLTGDAITWRRAHEKAPVAVRGSLTDLLLLIYRRRPVDGGHVEVIGDRALLDFWLERVSFG